MKIYHAKLLVATMSLTVFFAWMPDVFAEKIPQQKTGFLVLAPDRGFLGNQEIETLFNAFNKDYPATLALVGTNYNGVESEYSAYITRAVNTLKEDGATEIVVLPLFLSDSDPVLKKVGPHFPAYAAGTPVRRAAPFSESYLAAQVLLDRVSEKSRDAEREQVVILGAGVTNEAEEAALRADLEKAADYLRRYKAFQSVAVGIYYHQSAEAALQEAKNKAVNDLVIRTAAKKGHAIVAPFFIGPKFDNRMSMMRWLSNKFKAYDLSFTDREIMPHPNLLLWLKKTANAYLPASPRETGVVIMPHGATQPYNDAVTEIVTPLQSRYRIEMAWGMGDFEVIQQAVARLEAEGIRRIVFVRMYSLSDQMKRLTDYILGLTSTPPPSHHEGDVPPAQVRSAALFSSFGGYEEDTAIAQILLERIRALSREPARETVILVAHGAGGDEDNARWLETMEGHAEGLRRLARPAFLAIKTATVREDWPEKREAAVMQLKRMIQEDKLNGRVLLISNRLYGAGPYERLLAEAGLKKGEDYEMNGQGFAPHPFITRWLEAGIARAVRGFKGEELHAAAGRGDGTSPWNLGSRAALTAPGGGGAEAVSAELKEWAITLDRTTLAKPKAGSGQSGTGVKRKVIFKAKNGGTIAHELVVLKTGLAADALPVVEGKVKENAAGRVVGEIEALAPGAAGEVTLDLPEGQYVLFCNNIEDGETEGHYQKGMRTAFTIGRP